MSELTKEWLLKTIAELEEERDAMPGVVNEDAAMALAAMKLALASLEAEPGVNHQPVAWQYKEYVYVSGLGYLWREKLDCEFPGAECETLKDVVPLYKAPPAPVSVPDAYVRDERGRMMLNGRQEPRIGYGAGWNGYRAAMLQGADGNSPAHSGCRPAQNCISPAQCGNPPAIPDGWVACSERMPDIGTEIFYFCQDDGLRDCGIVSSSNFSGKGDAQLYVHAEGYDLRFGVDITHWMPMPATPQQEAKNV
ncbi:TPA: DUF551 domain-containing protein [Enterobacter hormaechei subsp. xiangfangensis]|nr:DUF551 domain-containing protein [Enterobacter hormaechei subsp. xiangfangensis]